MNKASLLLASFSALVASSMPVASETWKVGTDKNFPPYVIQEKGAMSGIHYDIVDAVMKKMGVNYKTNAYPWARVVTVTNGNEVDFSYPWLGEKSRFEKYNMAGPIQTSKNKFAVLASNNSITYDSLEDLKGLRIGTVRSFLYGQKFDEADFLKKDNNSTDNKALVQKLAAGRFDVIIGDENVINAEKRKLGLADKIKFLPKAVKEVSRYVAFHKSKPEKAKRFQEALDAIKADGSYDAVLLKHK